VKHLYYVFYVLFYAGAMFVAGLFFGQFMERRWAARERAEAEAATAAAAAVAVANKTPVMDEASIALSTHSHSPTR